MFNSKISSVAKLSGLFTFFILTILVLSATSFACTGTDQCTFTDPCVIDLIAGQYTKVGTVTVKAESGYLKVTYQTTSPWVMSATHFDVKSNYTLIPQSNGNPVPGNFQYKADHNPAVNNYTKTIPLPGYSPIYIAAHADVVKDFKTLLAASPYGEATGINAIAIGGKYVSNGSAYLDSYLLINMTVPGLYIRGPYKAYCVAPDDFMFGTYPDSIGGPCYYESADVSSSYGSLPGIIANPGNMGKVNYILNNYLDTYGRPKSGYTFGDIQAAIWYLVAWGPPTLQDKTVFLNGRLSNWDINRTSSIIDSTINQDAYIPPSWGLMALIFSDLYSQRLFDNPFNELVGFLPGQAFLIIVPVPRICGGSETAWGKGCDFPGRDWAMYFKYIPPRRSSSNSSTFWDEIK